MILSSHRSLPEDIQEIQREMRSHALAYGLDFFETIFEMVSYEEMSMLAAFGGFPVRYPHWRFGAEYDELMKGYSYGLQKIYEIVINTNPCYAYLLRDNMLVDQKLVIAHVYGHCDFFKNNAWFSPTNRRMLDQMANHASRFNRYIERHGFERVEQFIDACLSLDNLIDPYAAHFDREPSAASNSEAFATPGEDGIDGRPVTGAKFPSKEYMEGFINPPDVLRAEAEARRRESEQRLRSRSFPEKPQRDVLQFLLKHASLTDWQHDILSIVREEAIYFAPQGQTKIMNEGWACLAPESLVLTDRGLLPLRTVLETPGIEVHDGDGPQAVYDSAKFRERSRIRLRTASGFVLHGAANHRVLLADPKSWRRLDELQKGDRLAIAVGTEFWPSDLPNRVGSETANGSPAASSALATVQTSPAAGAGSPKEFTRQTVLRTILDQFRDASVIGDVVMSRELTDAKSERLQLELLNLGFVIRRTQEAAECFVLSIGRDEFEFLQIAADLDLGQPLRTAPTFAAEEIVELSSDRGPVLDISVTRSHRYVAQGFVNHNSYWHSTIMSRHGASDSDFVCYADHHSGTMAMSPNRLNPYKIGIELFRDIEKRWDRGQFGAEWDRCDDLHARENWDRRLGIGREKIFEVRRVHNDLTFIDTFLTPEFCRRHRMFSFAYNDSTDHYEIASRQFEQIKRQLLSSLTNHGRPFVYVVDGNYRNRGELYLKHEFHGVELRDDYARDTLLNLQMIWGRPVHLETVRDDEPTRLSVDGRDFSEEPAA